MTTTTTTTTTTTQQGISTVLASLAAELEEEASTREAVVRVVQRLERGVGAAQAVLSRVHSTPREGYAEIVAQVEGLVRSQIVQLIGELGAVASPHPYYRYNSLWNRTVQGAVTVVLTCGWLGGFSSETSSSSLSTTTNTDIDIDAASALPVPSSSSSSSPPQACIGNLVDHQTTARILGMKSEPRTGFHLPLEDYLHALPDLSSELARLAPNAVVLGDVNLPLTIAGFVKDLSSAFQLLNLRNDGLRRKADSLKYHVKRVEDVVYDLSLRGLVKY
ncbi:hypothetical protein L249_1923 [Ophiocordyceps polyrhachis-furcata BCC 54312]|uniref:Translin n=1 Tax=Ophiocordyceps polyrhachis-furcata BCC 54312 TaxID=1330021 RepID=A0A367LQJ7_9HYPO|nr:hypothetical protein L249_1923 [Ophiocordyceps polyrhachis-furcata BCC 54312]